MFNGTGTGGSPGPARGVASWPAAPAGMLLGSSPSWSRKTTAKWAGAERRLSVACAALGAVLVLASLKFAYNLTQWSGLLLGGLLLASGGAGYWGGARRSANATNLQLVGCLLGALLALTMIGEVRRPARWPTLGGSGLLQPGRGARPARGAPSGARRAPAELAR